VGVPGFNEELWLDRKMRTEKIIERLRVMEVPVIQRLFNYTSISDERRILQREPDIATFLAMVSTVSL